MKKASLPIALTCGTVEAEITYKKIKRIILKVADGKALLSAPVGVRLSEIRKFAQGHARWLEERLAYLSAARDTDGAVRYLGSAARVMVREGGRGVVFDGDTFTVTVPDGSDRAAKEVFREWWRLRAEEVFAQLTREAYDVCAAALGLTRLPRIVITRVGSYWGKCRPDRGEIRYNSYLLQADEDTVRYVVFHELVHLRHIGHDAAFYRALSSLYPRVREAKGRLRSYYTEMWCD